MRNEHCTLGSLKATFLGATVKTFKGNFKIPGRSQMLLCVSQILSDVATSSPPPLLLYLVLVTMASRGENVQISTWNFISEVNE